MASDRSPNDEHDDRVSSTKNELKEMLAENKTLMEMMGELKKSRIPGAINSLKSGDAERGGVVNEGLEVASSSGRREMPAAGMMPRDLEEPMQQAAGDSSRCWSGEMSTWKGGRQRL